MSNPNEESAVDETIAKIEHLAPLLDVVGPALAQVGPMLDKVMPLLEQFPTILESMQYRINVLEEKAGVLSMAYDLAHRDVADLKTSISVLIEMVKTKT